MAQVTVQGRMAFFLNPATFTYTPTSVELEDDILRDYETDQTFEIDDPVDRIDSGTGQATSGLVFVSSYKPGGDENDPRTVLVFSTPTPGLYNSFVIGATPGDFADVDSAFAKTFEEFHAVGQSNSTVFVGCFLAGTAIATPVGTTPVDRLEPGDPVLTADGRAVSVVWVARQRLSTLFAPPERLQPVRIRAGALGGGVPHRDLRLTADHALALDGMLVNAGALVGAAGIDWMDIAPLAPGFDVYNIECEEHEVLLAEGAAVESFVDMMPRHAFDNFADYAHPGGPERPVRERPVMRISASRLLPEPLRQRLGLRHAG